MESTKSMNGHPCNIFGNSFCILCVCVYVCSAGGWVSVYARVRSCVCVCVVKMTLDNIYAHPWDRQGTDQIKIWYDSEGTLKFGSYDVIKYILRIMILHGVRSNKSNSQERIMFKLLVNELLNLNLILYAIVNETRHRATLLNKYSIWYQKH